MPQQDFAPFPWFVDPEGNVYSAPLYKHTPFTDHEGHHHPDYHQGLVALVYGCDHSRGDNANLLGAAGDLYAAAKLAMEACGHYSNWNGKTKEFLEAIEAAVAKAEGGDGGDHGN